MPFSPLALILIPTGYFFLWPLVARWLGDDYSPLEVALTALILSIGTLGWGMLWMGLLPGTWLRPVVPLLIVLAGLLAGVILNRQWFDPARWLEYWRGVWQQIARFDSNTLFVGTIAAVLLIMLLHVTYYPFIGDDAISRYGLHAQLIYRAGRLPDEVVGYPPLAALSFVATWFAAGTANEQLAKLFSIATAAGVIGSTYILGRHATDRRAGLIAAALVALTPTFIRYGTYAYVDIPTTFPVTMALFFALRWFESTRFREALLAGVMVGIGLLIKQSALTWIASMAAVPVIWLLAARLQEEERRWRRALLGLAGFVLPVVIIAAPWYARNAILSGPQNILPVAGLYHLLEQKTGLIGLLPSLHWPGDFGPVLRFFYAAGWVMGMVYTFFQGIKVLSGNTEPTILVFNDRKEVIYFNPKHILFAAAVIPYWLAWWTTFSFDGRFLVFILPPMAVWTAEIISLMIDFILGMPIKKLPYLIRAIGGVILLGGLIYWGAKDRLGGVYYMLADPTATYEEKLLRAKGSMYELVMYIQENLDPETDRIVLMDGRMRYYLLDYDTAVFYPLKLSDLEGYDYLVHISSIYSIYNERLGWRDSEFVQHMYDEMIFETVYLSDDWLHIMRILRTDIPTPEEYEAFEQQKETP